MATWGRPGCGVVVCGRGADEVVCCTLAQDKEIDNAKMQVQGQLAAQYIQDVMQACDMRACTHLSEPRLPRSLLGEERADLPRVRRVRLDRAT